MADGEDAEFLPYGSHMVTLQLAFQGLDVDLGVVAVKVHCPVAELTESDASGGHVAYCVMENEECIEGGRSEAYLCAGIVPRGE